MGAQPQDDRIIVKNDVDNVSGYTVGTLTIIDALTDNDGLYECVAKNTGGVAYKNGHLTVEFPPSFRSMSNVTIWSWEQRPVNLTCIAESIPNSTIRWNLYGEVKIDQYRPYIEQIGNGLISILKVTPIDRRYYTNYKCIAANIHGTREHLIELREATKPGELLNVRMTEITATTIRFDLVPPMQADLPIRAITVQYKEKNQIWNNARNKTWSLGSLYVIEGLKPQTLYEFRFAAMNEVGMGNWGNFHTEITSGRTVPKEPRILVSPKSEYELSPYSHQYELSWVTPPDNGESIDMYLIKYCQIRRVIGEWEALPDTCIEVKSQGRTRQYLKDLKHDTFYCVELQAHNIMGFSNPGYAKFRTARESAGITVDYSNAGDTCKSVVAAITAAVMLLSLAI